MSRSRFTSPVARNLFLLAAACTGAGALGGCHAWNRIWGKDTVDLEKADVQSMSVDLRKERKTICPREQVQMAVFADVKLEGEKDKKSFETWAGRGDVNRNDKLDFGEFAFHSDLGAFDKDGWFAPNANILASVDREFEIKTVFKRKPDKFSFTTKYKPDYQCVKGGGRHGAGGDGGAQGSSGQAGNAGQSGSDSQQGGNGSNGGAGGPGADGANGGPGPHIVAYATYVKTPFYDKLVAVKIGGDVDDFLLAPVDQKITIKATGGPGGAGGAGGNGGGGGAGGSGNPGGNGGDGGPGGTGGKGGNGGPGGQIEFVVDSRYPDLANTIALDASGGAGGDAGAAGQGGSGGSAGNGITPQGSTQPAQSGQRGNDGPAGGQGAAGRPGPDGHASAHPGRVNDQFSGLDGVTILDDAGGGSTSGVADSQPAAGSGAGSAKKGASPKGGAKKKSGGGS